MIQKRCPVLEAPSRGRPIVHGDQAGKGQLNVGPADAIHEMDVATEGFPHPCQPRFVLCRAPANQLEVPLRGIAEHLRIPEISREGKVVPQLLAAS